MLATIMLVSSDMITKFGMWVILPVFIGFLFFIMWDISKKAHAGKQGTFWIFLILGAGFVSFLIKLALEWYFKQHLG